MPWSSSRTPNDGGWPIVASVAFPLLVIIAEPSCYVISSKHLVIKNFQSFGFCWFFFARNGACSLRPCAVKLTVQIKTLPQHLFVVTRESVPICACKMLKPNWKNVSANFSFIFFWQLNFFPFNFFWLFRVLRIRFYLRFVFFNSDALSFGNISQFVPHG